MKKRALVQKSAWLREGNNSWQNKVAAGGSDVHTATGRGCRGAGSVQTKQTELELLFQSKTFNDVHTAITLLTLHVRPDAMTL